MTVSVNDNHAVTIFWKVIILCCAYACSAPTERSAQDALNQDWPVANGSKGNAKYSLLTQINPENVQLLELAWEYHAGDEGYSIECNPIIIDKVLFATSPSVNAFALEATTGKELWTFDPYAYEGDSDRMTGSWAVNRGVTYWKEDNEERLFFGAGPYMYALNPKTGQPIPSFGENGRIDLLKGLDRNVDGLPISATSPGLVYQDLLFVGARVGENEGNVVPGHVRAYDVRTGERRWIFHTIPHPDEYGYETWPENAWETFGGANAWGGFSLDEERGLLFFGTGSPSHDHFGANRKGQNLFANSVVALNAETGERVWHYQLVHHDLWDYDLPTPPNLVTVTHQGRKIDAAAQVTKMGFLFLFDRVTGEPLFPIEERPVAQTKVPGEHTWPTQPFPSHPPAFARQGFRESDITDRTPEAHTFVRENVYNRYGDANLYDPPSFKGDIVQPQFNGGTDWGGAAVDPETAYLYVTTSNEPELMQVINAGGEASFPYGITGHQPVKDPEGYPITTPPWGTLTAIDLNAGNIVWQIPFGRYPGMKEMGNAPTGTFNMGGPVVTAGGLVFLGGSMDEKFRAIDKATGEVLWETQLPAGGYATPSVYAVDGKQYVVIAAGGGGKPGTKAGDAYLAFALPDKKDEQGDTQPDYEKEIETDAGLQLYTSRCASCHQYNGRGLGSDYPPLVDTDWVTGDKERLIKVVLGGLQGTMEVNEIEYNGNMPPWGDFLDDEQVATLLTYIRTSWGNQASSVSAQEIAHVREMTQGQDRVWSVEEICCE